MGLISWIKENYYEYKYNEACNYIHNKNTSNAEKILVELLSKHPLAIVELAKLYHSMATELNNRDALEFYKKSLLLEKKIENNFQYNSEKYNIVVNRIVQEIENRADKFYMNHNYELCLYFLLFIKKYTKIEDLSKLLFENREYYYAYCFLSVVVDIKNGDSKFVDKYNKYKLFYHLNVSYNEQATINAINKLSVLLNIPKLLDTNKDEVVKYCIDKIKNEQFYSRTCKILSYLYPSINLPIDIISESYIQSFIGKDKDKIKRIEYKEVISSDYYYFFYESVTKKLQNDDSFNEMIIFEICSSIIDDYFECSEIYFKAARKLHLMNINIPYNELVLNINKISDKKLRLEEYKNYVDVLIIRREYYSILKDLILGANSNEESWKILEKYWLDKYPGNILIEVLESSKFKYELLRNLVNKCTRYIPSGEASSICSFISNTKSENSESLDLLLVLHNNKYDVKEFYLNSLFSILENKKTCEKEDLINKSLIYYDESSLIEKKSSLILEYFENQEVENALRLANDLKSISKSVNSDLCYMYIELSKNNLEVDDKIKYIKLAENIWKNLRQQENKGRYSKVELRDRLNKVTIECINILEKQTRINEAVNLATSIIPHYKQAVSLIVRIYKDYLVKEELDTVKIEARCSLIKEAIGVLYNLDNNLSNDSNFIALWQCLINLVIKLYKNTSSNDKYEIELGEIWENINTCKLSCKADNIKKILFNELCMLKKGVAIQYETSGEYKLANNKYLEISNFSHDEYEWAILRAFICVLKSEDESIIKVSISGIDDIINSSILCPEKKELSYRYSIYLIKNKKYSNALEIIQKNLPEEKDLLSVCENYLIACEELEHKKFNDNIISIRDNKLTSDEAKDFLKTFDSTIDKFSNIAKVSSSKITQYKSLIKDYILYRLYIEKKYNECFVALKSLRPDYMSDLTIMRNLAIAALGIVENDLMDDYIYKDVIAIWLTSIYNERIFVDSLQYTTWDDNYQFTLQNAYGNFTENNYENLPSNVNFNEVTPNIVEIRAVQQSLLNRFESAIINNRTYYCYYIEQKNAMDLLVGLNLDEKCRVYAPELVMGNNQIKAEVKHALDLEESKQYPNWENVIKTATLYGFNGGVYTDYKNAVSYLNDCKLALEKITERTIKKVFVKSKINVINKFEILKGELYALVSSSFNEAKNNMDIDIIIKIYIIISKTINNSHFSYILSKFINQEAVKMANEEEKDLVKATRMMLEAYTICTTNSTIEQNLNAMIVALINKYLIDADNDDLDLIKEILVKGTFNSVVVKALKADDDDIMRWIHYIYNEENFNKLKNAISNYSPEISSILNTISQKIGEMKINQELNQLIEDVNNGNLKPKDALDKLYTLYTTDSLNDNVCKCLIDIVKMCIYEYIIQDNVGRVGVIRILDKLRYNKSSTYRTHAVELSNERRNFLNQMSSDNRNVILYHSDMLNKQGKDLKLALDYLQYLS